MQLGWPLPFILDAYSKRTLEIPGRIGNGLGNLGHDQLEWLEDDVAHLSASTPIVVFAHVPLWIVYQDWGWCTADGAQALSYLKKFG